MGTHSHDEIDSLTRMAVGVSDDDVAAGWPTGSRTALRDSVLATSPHEPIDDVDRAPASAGRSLKLAAAVVVAAVAILTVPALLENDPLGPSSVIAVERTGDEWEIRMDSVIEDPAATEREARSAGANVRFVPTTSSPAGVGRIISYSGHSSVFNPIDVDGPIQVIRIAVGAGQELRFRVGVAPADDELPESVVYENLLASDPRFGCGKLVGADAASVAQELRTAGFDRVTVVEPRSAFEDELPDLTGYRAYIAQRVTADWVVVHASSGADPEIVDERC